MTRNFTYPPARQDDVVEDYHGTPVADPYRWLEDPRSDETRAWVQAENDLTTAYLSEISAREHIHQRLTALWNYPKQDAPQKKGGYRFFLRNDGLQNQAVMFKQRDGGEPEVLLDPNTFSDDGTTALTNWRFDKDGALLAYATSEGGSDWQQIRVRAVESAQDYDDVLNWVKFTSIAWLPDASGFYYSRYPEPQDEQQSSYYHKVYFHAVGTPQADDVLIYERPDAKEYNFAPMVSDDGRYLVLYIYHGSVNKNRIYYREIGSEGDFVRLLDEADAHYGFVGNDDTVFYFETNKDADMGRVIAIDVSNPAPEHWREVIAESEDALLDLRLINDQFIAHYLHHAHSRITVYTLDGIPVNDVTLPAIGFVNSITGERDDTEMFFSFQSHLHPQSVYRYDFGTQQIETIHQPALDFDTSLYETKQVFFESKDGTRVPMFITARKDIDLNGDNPTWVYGYGGFSAAHTPTFHPWRLNWLEMGGVFVDVNLRGGDEYGEAWHLAGALHNKQNVFDDFIGACEWMIDNGYTRPEKLAIYGRSNGGLLVAACMIQRPELFGSVICVVPVTDMLRFHKFTAGRFWTYEYGNAEENADHFAFLYAYSPLHNVKAGETYPPILITSADHDDRVVPLHSKKFTAALQAADSGQNPVLLRLDTMSGHGAGKPTSKWIDEWADIQAFLVRTLKMD